MSNLKYRLLVIAALCAASIWALYPRTVIERVSRNGVFVYDTVQRVPLKRGLDLQGGMYLSLEIDESEQVVADKSEALDRALTVVRARIDEFGVSEPVIQKAGDERIVVQLPGIDDPRRAEEIVQRSAFLQFQITDETQALPRVVPRLDAIARDLGLATATPTDTGDAPAIGLEGLLTRGADTTAGDSAEAAGDSLSLASGGPFSRSIQPGQIPGQYFVAQADVPLLTQLLQQPEIQAALPPGKEVKWGVEQLETGGQAFAELWVVDARPILTGERLTDAFPSNTPIDGTVVSFELDNVGGRRFKAETARNIQSHMAIVLDNRVITAPIIQSSIGTRGQITLGNRDLQEAQDLALVLRAGALPVPLKIADVRQIGASLGQDSVRRGIIASLVSVSLVVLILAVYYRFSGMLAIAGLMIYLLFTLAVLAGFDAVLTLPGLAGFVLSIGIAVDANVLIFERIREELDRGKSVRLAIDEGFRQAMSAIVDSNVTTALTAAVLYQFGTGPVRGFAVTLLAGIAASMVTSIFIVKTFFLVWLNRSRGTQALSI